MTKTDYTKMENLLTEGLLKMSMGELMKLADQASSFKNANAKEALPSVQARSILISFMQADLETLLKVEGVDTKRLGITPKELKALASNPQDLKPEEWDKIKSFKEALSAYKQELHDKIPHLSDEELIEKERVKHINKRHNVRDKWLPLH